MKSPLLLLIAFAGCSGVGLTSSDPEERFADERINVVNDGTLSKRTRQFLFRNNISSLEEVEKFLRQERTRDPAFHLAEMLYREAGRTNDRTLYVAAAFYAQHYLFDPDLGPLPNPFDPLSRWAVDIYNLSLARFGPWLLETKQHSVSVLGRAFEWESRPPQSERYRPATAYEAKGLNRFSRAYGLGLPLIAERTDERGYTMAYARTMLVDFEGSAVTQEKVRVNREIYDPSATESVVVRGFTIPLEADYSTPIAYFMQREPSESGLIAMVDPKAHLKAGGLYMMAPFDKGKIPVVFVHGLMADMERWARMINDLASDPELRRRYQFWLYAYPTGLPIVYSAMILREGLERARGKHGFDNVVIVSHSMGGLVSKLCVLSSGDRLTRLVSSTPFQQWKLSKDSKSLLGRALRFKRLPYVRRIVFMASPHRGASLASSPIGKLGELIINLPDDINSAHDDLKAFLEKDPGRTELDPTGNMMTGVGNLEPDNPFQKEIVTWSFDPSVTVHTVIGNKDRADTPGGSDGLVSYESAHLDGVASEKIIKSRHKGVPETSASVAEVRRILHLHLKQLSR